MWLPKGEWKQQKWFPAVDTRLVLFSFLFTCLKHKEREGEEKNKEMKKERKEESTFSWMQWCRVTLSTHKAILFQWWNSICCH